MKRIRITVDENLYATFKELCSANKVTQANMLETLMDSYRSTSETVEELVERISSLEIELLALRNQLIS